MPAMRSENPLNLCVFVSFLFTMMTGSINSTRYFQVQNVSEVNRHVQAFGSHIAFDRTGLDRCSFQSRYSSLVLWVGTSYMIPIVYRYIDSYTALFLLLVYWIA